jgi:hypothetical protein
MQSYKRRKKTEEPPADYRVSKTNQCEQKKKKKGATAGLSKRK